MAKTILVVDDDNVSRTLIKSKLAANGFDVLTAGDGQEALELMAKAAPDLIFLDVEMPRMNGYTFITNVRRQEASAGKSKVPVVMLTGHEENEPLFRRHSIRAYLVKPVDIEALLAKAKEILNPT